MNRGGDKVKTRHLLTLVLAVLMATSLLATPWVQASTTKMITQEPRMEMTIPIPENLTTQDKVQTSIGSLEFFDGVPIGNTSGKS